ncbi:MAG: zinc ribbon domain-containing protein [Acidobacteriota bacterium]|nr:zinc ribbon domain-containing protein [Acidobacteriota bacterium]
MLKFLYPILDSISEGPFIRQVLKYCLRVFAGIMALVGLIALIAILKLSFSQAVPTSVSIAGLAIACLFVAATVCQIQIFLYRAGRIEALPPTRYTVIPAAVQLLRLAGEVLATSICTLGIAAFIASIMAGEAGPILAEVLPGPFGRVSGSGFGGFVALLFALVAAFTFLVIFYLIAEGLQLTLDVADDVRSVADTGPAFSPAAPSTLPAAEGRPCSSCRSLVPAGNAFCNICGTRVYA